MSSVADLVARVALALSADSDRQPYYVVVGKMTTVPAALPGRRDLINLNTRQG